MRDDFTQNTKRILARRVGYKCSFPACGKPTDGPHTNQDKYLSIGVAAHITAASPGGPRYDDTLTPEQRRNIDNAIWLCETHAKMIDKDEKAFTVEMIVDWKQKAEESQLDELKGTKEQIHEDVFLDLDLRFVIRSRKNKGLNFSETKLKYGEQPISPIQAIRNFTHEYKYDLLVFNNSNNPIFNLKIKDQNIFDYIEKIPRVNNLNAFEHLELGTQLSVNFVGTGKDSKTKFDTYIPEERVGNYIELEFLNYKREIKSTKYIISKEGEITAENKA